MQESTIWWLLAGGLVVLELLSGTVYLLLLSAGFAAAALSAHAGVGLTLQFVVAAVVGAGAVLAWRTVRKRQPPALDASANPDAQLDIGERIHVPAWMPDGTAQVRYRGAQWTVMSRPGTVPLSGEHRVVEVIGSRLVVEPI